MPSNANSNFLTRIPEPVSTTYAPYRGVCVRTKGVYGILSTPQKSSSIRSDVIRHPPYNCLITAYLRPIYGSFTLPHRYHYVTSETHYKPFAFLSHFCDNHSINPLNPLQRVKRRSLTSGRKNVFLRTEEREHGERSIERRSRESF